MLAQADGQRSEAIPLVTEFRKDFRLNSTEHPKNTMSPFFPPASARGRVPKSFRGVDDALFCLLFIHDTPSPTQSLDAGDLIEVGIIAKQRQSVLAYQGGDP